MKMEHQEKYLPIKCPACNSNIKIGRLFCNKCNTEICGSFELPILAKLSDKEQQFIIDFIRCSGNLKKLAQTMQISYPTIRNFLNIIIDKLK